MILTNYGVVWKVFKSFALRHIYISITLALIPSLCLLPYLSRINNKLWFMGCFIACNTSIMTMFNITLASIQLYFQNSIKGNFIPLTLATNQTIDSIAISVIVPICTDLYSWATSWGDEQLVYPFNYCLSFVFLALLIYASLIPFIYISDEVEQKS